MSGYIFDNAAERETEQRFGSLAALYDPRTIRFWRRLALAPAGAAWNSARVAARSPVGSPTGSAMRAT